MQNRFNLWNQKITIPNGTQITYKQLIIPACNDCNNIVFGKLEQKMKYSKASDIEIWQWANKIHFGLWYKDGILNYDRKKPGVKISDVYQANDVLKQSRHFLLCVRGGFNCDPNPFGSVFTFEFEEEQPFNFVHLLSSSSIYICLGNVAYIIFVTDGQILKKDMISFQKSYQELKKKPKQSLGDSLFFYAKCVYFFEQYTYSNPIMFSPEGLVKIGSATLRGEKPLNKEHFRYICDKLGVTWIDQDEL